MTFDAKKTKIMIFGSNTGREKLSGFNITFGNVEIEQDNSYNYIWVKLTFDLHMKAIIQRVSDKVWHLRRIRHFINNIAAISIYKNMILPILEYVDVPLISAKLSLRKKCALGLDPLANTDQVHELTKLDNLDCRCKQHIIQVMYKQLLKRGFSMIKKKCRILGVATRTAKKKM